MYIEVLEDDISYLNIILSCDPKANDENEIIKFRTCASSTITNLTLICNTIMEFG